jgi:hypothetical protein
MNEVQLPLLLKVFKENYYPRRGNSLLREWRIAMFYLTRILLLVLTTIIISACGTTSVQRSYITIRETEALTEINSGEEFEVLPGDSLNIIDTKSCADGDGVCWKVTSANTGKVGFVNAELMQDRHEVYIEEKGRTFVDGTFQSKHPKLTVNINPGYKYVGFNSEIRSGKSVSGTKDLFIKIESYMFVKSIDLKKDSENTENISPTETEVTKTFIKILRPENIYFGGEVLYTVNPGDTLEKLYSKTCLDGYGECWGVRNLKDNHIGIINASIAKLRHQVYSENVVQTQKLPDKTDKNWLKNVMNIEFRRVETYYAGQLFSQIKDRLQAGVEQHADKNYQYYIRKVYPDMRAAKTRYLYEKGGYVLPKCVLVKEIGRVVGASQDMLISILYFEDILDHGFSCSAFPINRTSLNEKEIKFIEEFNMRSKFAYEIVLSQ